MLLQIRTLIVATSLVQLANGFFGTFFSLRVADENFGPALSGLVLSAYFAGFILSAMSSGRIIARVGYIRAYAAFAGSVIMATVVMPLVVDASAWIILRGIIGFGCAGLFIATESWLNEKSEPVQRGRVFSIYMVGMFLALALGQVLIIGADMATAAPFNGIAALFAVGLVLVSTMRAEPPQATAEEHLPYGMLTRAAPLAVAGAAASGLVSAAFYALVPAWMQDDGFDRETIALFMLTAVLGGLVLQLPVGRLSDRFDRRLVLAGLALGFSAVSALLVNLPHSRWLILPAAAMLGGFMSTIYPVCVANAHDLMPANRVVAVSGRLIFVSGLGSIVGPMIGSGVMALLDIDGLGYFMSATTLALAALALALIRATSAPKHLQRTFRILSPSAAPIAHGAIEDPNTSQPAREGAE